MQTPPPMAQPQQPPEQPSGLTPQQLTAAIQVGLKMLQSGDISSPNSWRGDLNILEQVLIGLLTRKLRIIPAQLEAPAGAAPPVKTEKPFPREVTEVKNEEELPVLELETAPPLTHADREA